MRIRVLRPPELTPALHERWRELQRSHRLYASPFFHPAFTQMVARSRDDVHVGVCEEEDNVPLGFFPFQRARFGVGQPVGWTLCDYQGVVAAPGCRWEARELLSACGLRWFQFDHLPAAQEPFGPFQRAHSPSLMLDLSDGFERYAQRQERAGSHTVGRLAKRLRRLERDHGPARFEAHVTERAALDTLLSWKSAQYRRTGMADLLARPWFREVTEAAAHTEEEGFAGMLSVLYAGDRLVAAHLGLRSDTVWHYWLPAHDVDPALAACSPGLLLILAMARHAESLGVRALDFGKGETRHKREFANSEVQLAEGWVRTSPLALPWQWRREARALARRSGLGPRARRVANRLRGGG